jgi:hypothetical protein
LIVLVTPIIVDPMNDHEVIEDPQPALPYLDPKKFDAGLPPLKK